MRTIELSIESHSVSSRERVVTVCESCGGNGGDVLPPAPAEIEPAASAMRKTNVAGLFDAIGRFFEGR